MSLTLLVDLSNKYGQFARQESPRRIARNFIGTMRSLVLSLALLLAAVSQATLCDLASVHAVEFPLASLGMTYEGSIVEMSAIACSIPHVEACTSTSHTFDHVVMSGVSFTCRCRISMDSTSDQAWFSMMSPRVNMTLAGEELSDFSITLTDPVFDLMPQHIATNRGLLSTLSRAVYDESMHHLVENLVFTLQSASIK